MFKEDKKVAENDQCIFYVNSMTEGATRWADGYGLELDCLLAVQKSNPDDKDYVLIKDEEFIYHTKQYEALGVHIDMIAASEGKKRE